MTLTMTCIFIWGFSGSDLRCFPTLKWILEPKVNSSLINRVIMVYEFRTKTSGTHRSISSLKIKF